MKVQLLPALTIASVGMLMGLGGATVNYAEGLSYLSKAPESCANCHIMLPQYDGWQKTSHHQAATCADCHLPEPFPDTYIAKSENGWNHSKAFTLQNFPEPITITPKNAGILQTNCLRCHGDLVHALSSTFDEGAPRCVRCHQTVGHGDPVGLGGPWRPLLETGAEQDPPPSHKKSNTAQTEER